MTDGLPRTLAPLALLSDLPSVGGPVNLRPLRESDLADFLAYRSDPVVARYQGWRPMGAEKAAAFLAEMAAPPAWRTGSWVQIGIARAAPHPNADQLVGDIGLLREGPAQVQIGISLRRDAQGQGLAQAALRSLLRLLFGPLQMQTLRAVSDARNASSLRLFSALGFVETAREQVQFQGEACTEVTLVRQAPRPPLTEANAGIGEAPP